MKGTADIDLVVYINGLSSIRNLERKRGDLLEALKEEIDDYEWDDDIECIKTSKFSVSYRLGDHEVDILPAFDVLEGNYRYLGLLSPLDLYFLFTSLDRTPARINSQYVC